MEPTLFNPDTCNISEDGQRVRKCWCMCMRKYFRKTNYGKYVIPSYDGGRAENGRNYSGNIWDKLSAKLTAEHIDAVPYIEYTLSTFKVELPSMLLSAAYLADYKQYIGSIAKEKRWETEEKSVLTQLSILLSLYQDRIKVLSRVINDDQFGASALVRYAFAVKNNCQYLASERTRELAFTQYRSRQNYYDGYYYEAVPQEFREVASTGK